MSYPASYRYKRKRVPKKAKILIIVGAVLAAVMLVICLTEMILLLVIVHPVGNLM